MRSVIRVLVLGLDHFIYSPRFVLCAHSMMYVAHAQYSFKINPTSVVDLRIFAIRVQKRTFMLPIKIPVEITRLDECGASNSHAIRHSDVQELCSVLCVLGVEKIITDIFEWAHSNFLLKSRNKTICTRIASR